MTNSSAIATASFRRLSPDEFEAITREEIIRRARLYDQCARSDRFRAAQVRLSRNNPVYFFNNFLWTFDPRTKRKKYPLALFPYQKEYVEWLEARYVAREWGHAEKSRDVGATWLNAGHSIQKWLFEPGFSALFGSISEAKVDDFSLNSTFGKLRFMIENLPAFMRPVMDPKRDDKHLHLSNPGKGSLLKGESMNLSFGRSGRSSIAHLDEFAHIANSTAVLSSMSQNSNCAIFTSTPLGSGNEFARMKKENKIPSISLHWSKHPLKDKAWYDEQADKMPDWMVAQELDISYERSVGNRYYKRFNRAYHVSKENIFFDENARQYVFWDFGHGGAMAILFIQVTADGHIQVWCDYEVTDQDVDFCLPVTSGGRPVQYVLLKSSERAYIDKVLKKVHAGHVAIHGGDNSGVSKTANSKRSCKDAIEGKFKKDDPNFRFHSSGKQTYDWRWKCVDNILKLRQNQEEEWVSRLQVSPDCERFIECMNNASYDGTNPHTDNPKPKLDQFFHMVSAFEFFCINEFPLKQTAGFKEVDVR